MISEISVMPGIKWVGLGNVWPHIVLLPFIMDRMKFTLMVNSSPFRSQGVYSAYCFANAALAQGHAVIRVFFYGDGVYIAMAHTSQPADEPQLIQLWYDLAQNNGVDLVLCSAAAERRGVLGAKEDDAVDFSSNVAPGFRIAGLGLWMDACLAADRVIVFHG